ncbi:MAG TPA: hypothetical protein VG937_10555 [Polyangiaceae bacterium]|nr:hypothetical protein [Polyangiaceae bacterium]
MRTSDCGCNQEGKERRPDATCQSCRVEQSCRNNYYTGKLLTARDFKLEQSYFRDKLRLHHLALHGWGVVCGLEIRPHPYCPELKFVLTTGLAIDTCGREVRVLEPQDFALPQPPEVGRRKPCDDDVPEPPPGRPSWKGHDYDEPAPPSDPEGPASWSRSEAIAPKRKQLAPEPAAADAYATSAPPAQAAPAPARAAAPAAASAKPAEVAKPAEAKQAQSPPPPPPPPPQGGEKPRREHQHEPCPEGPVPVDLYICIRYRECEEERAPAPFDECSCDSPAHQANRICEGFELDYSDTKPKWWDEAFPEHCSYGDCTEIWQRARECGEPPCVPCLPLAIIRGFVPGQAVIGDQIENQHRAVLPSTTLLKHAIDCILEKLPVRDYTKIDYFNWAHGRRFHCHEFFNEHVGSKEAPGYFEVRFSRPVVPESVSTRSFVLTVVYRDEQSSPREMHIAPTRISYDAVERTFRLEIDHSYAHRHLANRKFDVYIRLAGDKILDRRGHAVDANLLARTESDDAYVVSFPTGNGTPGGEFESWISVR